MKYNWHEIPVKVKRNNVVLTVHADEVQAGDIVWLGPVPHVSEGCFPDDDEEIMYIKINGIDCWPAAMFER